SNGEHAVAEHTPAIADCVGKGDNNAATNHHDIAGPVAVTIAHARPRRGLRAGRDRHVSDVGLVLHLQRRPQSGDRRPDRAGQMLGQGNDPGEGRDREGQLDRADHRGGRQPELSAGVGVLGTIAAAAGVFAGTDIDDLVVLTVLFLAGRATGRPRTRDIVVGQYLGIAALVAFSAAAAVGLLVVPDRWVGLIGLVPI